MRKIQKFLWKCTTTREKPSASVIIRFSNQSKVRLVRLCTLVQHILRIPDLEIIVSVMGKDINGQTPGITKIFTKGTFESAKANNVGASHATSDIFIFQDADIIFRKACYRQIMSKISKGFDTIRVGKKCVNLNHTTAGQIAHDVARLDKVVNTKFTDSIRDAPGGCFAVTREAFVRVGGHCELFKFYGWEDCYMRYKLGQLTKHICLNEQMIHLPHETNFQIGKQAAHRNLYEGLLYTDDGNCKKLSARDKIALLQDYPVFAKG